MRAVKEVQQQASGRQAGVAAAPKVASFLTRAQQFLRAVRTEMRNVTWPGWEDVKSTTVTVVLTAFFFGFYLGMALDVPLARFMRWLLAVGRELVS